MIATIKPNTEKAIDGGPKEIYRIKIDDEVKYVFQMSQKEEDDLIYEPPYKSNDINLSRKPCASEGKTCKCKGRVFYGTWKTIMLNVEQRYGEKEVEKSIKCTYENFGFEEKRKGHCYCEAEDLDEDEEEIDMEEGPRNRRSGKEEEEVEEGSPVWIIIGAVIVVILCAAGGYAIMNKDKDKEAKPAESAHSGDPGQYKIQTTESSMLPPIDNKQPGEMK